MSGQQHLADECPECRLERRAGATSNLHVRLFVATNPDRALCVSPFFGALLKTHATARREQGAGHQ